MHQTSKKNYNSAPLHQMRSTKTIVTMTVLYMVPISQSAYNLEQKLRWDFSLCSRTAAYPSGHVLLTCGFATTQLLGFQVAIVPEAWTPVYCECCVLKGRGLCNRLITRPEDPTECSVWNWVWLWSLISEDTMSLNGFKTVLLSKAHFAEVTLLE